MNSLRSKWPTNGIVLLVVSFALSSIASAAPREVISTYTNPLDVIIADPAALLYKGTYYLTGTTFARYVSTDLVHWRRQGNYFDPVGTWVHGWPWAAELSEEAGRFYYLFAAPGPDTGRKRCICVAVSDSPAGQFRPLAMPLWQDQYSWIDPDVFADDDGTRYLYVTRDDVLTGGNSEIWVAPLKTSMDGLAGPLRRCLSVSQPWEHRTQEGVTVFKHAGTYYMTYSSNGYGDPRYAVGYAIAPSPFGPWIKSPENPILMRDRGVSGPGHNGVCRSPDGKEWFVIYHTHVLQSGGGLRQLALDRLRFVPSASGPDRLVIDGPTTTPQPLPSGAAPLPVFTGRDEFSAPQLNRDRWITVFNEDPDSWRLDNGAMVIRMLAGDVYEKRSDARNIFLQYAPGGDFEITAKVTAPVDRDSNQAFVIVWQNCQNYVVLKAASLQKPMFEAAVELDGVYSSTFSENTIGDTIQLRIRRTGRRYDYFASADGKQWIPVGSPVRCDLQNIRVGFGAFATGKADGDDARFEFFDVEK